MELILNDFSIEGQFDSEDDFDDYVVEKLKPLLESIEKLDCALYKKTDTYNRKITQKMTFAEYIMKVNSPVSTLLKTCIINLTYRSPYWDEAENLQTRAEVSYEYPLFSEDEPNCFTEAIERSCPLLSLEKSCYADALFLCRRNGEEIILENIRDKKCFLESFLKRNMQSVRLVMEEYPFEKEVSLAVINGHCYAEDALLENNLTLEDVQKIIENIDWMIRDKTNGHKSHWWDVVGDGICEYRVSVSDGREFRLFFIWQQQIIFLNGFIKKTKSIPEAEKRRAQEIAKEFNTNPPA